MRSYLTPEGQKNADAHAIKHIGVSGALLMENAASGSAHCIAMWLMLRQSAQKDPQSSFYVVREIMEEMDLQSQDIFTA